MSVPRSSRFGALAQAVKERTGAAAEADAGEGSAAPAETAPARPLLTNAGVHAPSAALGNLAEGLRERVARLEALVAELQEQLAGLRGS